MTAVLRGHPKTQRREISSVGGTLGSSCDCPLQKDSLRYESLLTGEVADRLTDQGHGKKKIGRPGTKRSSREVCGLSEWVRSVKAVVFYINSPQRTSTAKKTHQSGRNEVTHPAGVSQSPPLALWRLLSGSMEKVATAAGMLCVDST